MAAVGPGSEPVNDDATSALLSTRAIELLRSTAAASGVTCDASTVRDALARAIAENPGDWQSTWTQRLSAVAESMQMHSATSALPIRDLLELPRPGAPVILFVASGQPSGWVMLTDRSLRKIRVDRGAGQVKWISRRRLLRQLNLDEKTPVPFVALQAQAPCEVVSRHHGDAGHGHLEPTPLRRLRKLLSLDTRDLVIVAVFALGVGVLSLATPITVELLVGTIAFGNLMQPVVVLSLLLFTCLAFVVGMQLIQTYVVEILQRRIFVRFLADLAYRVPRVAHANGRYLPEFVNRFLEVANFQKSLASLLLDGLFIVLQAVFGMIVLAFYHPYLLGYDVVMLAAIAGIIFVLGRGATRTAIAESIAKYDAVAWLEELARQPLSVKAQGGAELALSGADHYAREYLSARSSHFRILMRQITASLGLQVISSTTLLGLGGWLVIQRELTLGQLVAAELIVSNIVRSFAKFGKHFESYYDLLASAEKLGHLLDLPLERVGGEYPARRKQGASLTLADVEPMNPGKGGLVDALDLQVKAGERVAIVGPTASGKSSLLQLVYGLQSPASGFVLYDGTDMRQLDLSAVRSQAAFLQGLELLRASILENVRWGRSDVSVSDANAALADVGLAETVLRLPDGLNTRLEPDGSPLSQGEALAVKFARSIAGKPRLLLIDAVLDELNSPHFEQVCETLFDPEASWTVLITTNRDDVQQRCGRTIELGSPGARVSSPISEAPA